jgi:thiol-disulfide isomerase/thioredoxin
LPGGRLRLRTWRREELEAGVVALTAIIIGGVVLFYFLQSGPLQLAASASGGYIINSRRGFEELLGSGQPVAVMFSSDSCPVCQQMEPYWARLCRASGLPVGLRY